MIKKCNTYNMIIILNYELSKICFKIILLTGKTTIKYELNINIRFEIDNVNRNRNMVNSP